MRRTLSSCVVTLVLVLTAAPVVRAEMPYSIWRWNGVGSGDGYHSRAGCPPKPQIHHQRTMWAGVPVAPAATETTPWWKIPASGAESGPVENMPTPATAGQASSGTVVSEAPVTTGGSLFRQPGEGAPSGTLGGFRF